MDAIAIGGVLRCAAAIASGGVSSSIIGGVDVAVDQVPLTSVCINKGYAANATGIPGKMAPP